MKNILGALLLSLVLPQWVLAQSKEQAFSDTRKLVSPLVERNYLKAGLSLSSGALNMALEYESLMDQKGWSAYGLLATEKQGVQNQALVLGAGLPIYVLQGNHGQVSLTPGAGLIMVSGNGQSETGLGLHLKISALRQVGSLRMGAEHFLVSNWLNDKLPAMMSWTLLTFAFAL